jgi:hypothetical protein
LSSAFSAVLIAGASGLEMQPFLALSALFRGYARRLQLPQESQLQDLPQRGAKSTVQQSRNQMGKDRSMAGQNHTTPFFMILSGHHSVGLLRNQSRGG